MLLSTVYPCQIIQVPQIGEQQQSSYYRGLTVVVFEILPSEIFSPPPLTPATTTRSCPHAMRRLCVGSGSDLQRPRFVAVTTYRCRVRFQRPSQLYKRLSYNSVIIDKPIVVIIKAEKGLNALYIVRGYLVTNYLNLLKVNFNSFYTNNKPKVLYTFYSKFAFLNINLQAYIPQSLQDLLNINLVLKFIV